MNRFKFRCWDIFTEKFLDNFFISNDGKIRYGSVSDELQLEKKGYIIMQWIGLEDRYGKNVYENDIIKYPDYYDGDIFKKSGLAVVKYDEVSFYAIDNNLGMHSLWDIIINNGEIIGNIFENPELMEKKN